MASSQELAVLILHIFPAALSFIACMALILLNCLSPLLRALPQNRIILYLIIADLFNSLQAFFGFPKHDNSLCITQGFLQQFSGTSSCFWTAIISSLLYNTIVRQVPRELLYKRSKEWCYILIGFGGGLIFALLPLFTSSYGPAGFWCWIKADEEEQGAQSSEFILGLTWRLLQYIQVWGVIIYNVVIYCKIHKHLKRGSTRSLNRSLGQKSERDEEKDRPAFYQQEDKGGQFRGANGTNAELMDSDNQPSRGGWIRILRFLPMILVACWGPATINRTYELFSRDEQTWLLALAIFSLGLTGLLNSIVYGCSSMVRYQVRRVFCCKKENSGEDKNVSRRASKERKRNSIVDTGRRSEKNDTFPGQEKGPAATIQIIEEGHGGPAIEVQLDDPDMVVV